MPNLKSIPNISHYAGVTKTLLECMNYLASKAPEESYFLPDLIEIAHERAFELACALEELEECA